MRRLTLWLWLAPLWLAAQIPSPSQFLGYEPGSRFTPVQRVTDYYRAVAAAAPDRVVLTDYGQSYEGRPLVYAVVSSPQNIQRREEIRQNNLRRTGIASGSATDDGIAIVWMSYNIHGNESVSSEAAMVVLYRLLTERHEQLNHAVVILDPCMNPDGRNRYVEHFAQTVGSRPNVDRYSREHIEPWPGGRFNHYLFDLNRDWAWQSQHETRVRTAAYRQWMPHVHCDFHEMGPNEPYFFTPAADPVHTTVTPWQRDFQQRLGRKNAETFNQNGWRYYTKETYDLFYPSYGDTWPTFQGAIGMTFEQGGSGQAGLAIRIENGDTLTLKDRMDHHVACSMNTVATAVENRQQLTREFAQFFRSPAAANGIRGYWVQGGPAGSPQAEQLWLLRQHLDKLNIRYRQVSAARAVAARRHGGKAAEQMRIAAGDLWVPLDQPQGRLAHILFEESPVLPDSLTYDLTAWGLNFAYGLNAAALAEAPGTQEWPAETASATAAMPVEAFLVRWNGIRSVRFLARVLEAGIRVRAAEKPFRRNGVDWPAGTLVLSRAEAKGDWLAKLTQVAKETQVVLVDAGPGPNESGPDFGSDYVGLVGNRKIAVLTGPGTSPTQAGAAWHWFDEIVGYNASIIPVDVLGSIPATRLAEYQVIVMPSGSYSSGLTKAVSDRLMDWVRGGGRLVAIEGAVNTLARNKDWGLKLRQDSARSRPDLGATYADRVRNQLSSSIQGAIMRVSMDETHPLTFGVAKPYHTLKTETLLEPIADAWNVGYLTADSYVAGFVGADVKPRLKGTAVWVVNPIGRGQVVALADDPLFRASWPVGWQVFANAVWQPMN